MNKKGFTLVELLVVIAIIGILSSVAVVNLNSARDKAKIAAAQAALSQMATPIILCFDENETDSGDISQPQAGSLVCPGVTAKWVSLPGEFVYDTISSFTRATYVWSFSATEAGFGTVTCDEAGCEFSSGGGGGADS